MEPNRKHPTPLKWKGLNQSPADGTGRNRDSAARTGTLGSTGPALLLFVRPRGTGRTEKATAREDTRPNFLAFVLRSARLFRFGPVSYCVSVFLLPAPVVAAGAVLGLVRRVVPAQIDSLLH
jgi:hypothetical protein